MPSPEACADETDRELRAEIERLRACLRGRDKLNREFQAEIDRLRGVIADLVQSYDFCAADPADRGWAVMGGAVEDARPDTKEQ